MKVFRNSLLTILLIPTICVVFQPYCSPLVASYLYLFTLIIIPLCAVNILLFLFVVYLQSAWRWIYGLISLVSLGLVSTSYGFSFNTKVTRANDEIRLVSWNADNFLLNKDILFNSAAFIRGLNADIVCLQERPHDNLLQWETIKSVFQYPYWIKNDREDEVLNLAVFSRWPLLNKRVCYFPHTYNKFLYVDIKRPNGVIRLFNVHLQTTGMSEFDSKSTLTVLRKNAEIRYQQVEILQKLIDQSPYPVILCGDFNDLPYSFTRLKLMGNLNDCFKEKGKGWGGTFQRIFNLFRIDYLLCSSNFETSYYQLFSNPWSDHKIQFGIINFIF